MTRDLGGDLLPDYPHVCIYIHRNEVSEAWCVALAAPHMIVWPNSNGQQQTKTKTKTNRNGARTAWSLTLREQGKSS